MTLLDGTSDNVSKIKPTRCTMLEHRLSRRELLQLAGAGTIAAVCAHWLRLPDAVSAATAVNDPRQAVQLTFPFAAGTYDFLQQNWHAERSGTLYPYNHRTTTRAHDGEDVACPNLTPVYACVSGQTVDSSTVSGDGSALPYARYGNVVVIQNSSGDLFVYAHLADGSALAPGNNVVEGQTQVGLASFTGNATGPHLHLEVRLADFACPFCAGSHYFSRAYPIDPVPSLQAAISAGRFALPAQPPPSTGTMSVAGITYATSGGKDGRRHLTTTAQVLDGNGAAVAAASISVRLDNTARGRSWTFSGSTQGDGRAAFTLTRAPSGRYVTTVTSLVKPGFEWDGVTPANEFTK
jgi:Peptidase family M23